MTLRHRDYQNYLAMTVLISELNFYTLESNNKLCTVPQKHNGTRLNSRLTKVNDCILNNYANEILHRSDKLFTMNLQLRVYASSTRKCQINNHTNTQRYLDTLPITIRINKLYGYNLAGANPTFNYTEFLSKTLKITEGSVVP